MFKEDCIVTMLMVTDGTFSWGFHEELLDQNKFRDYFKENVMPDQDRWDSFHNKLNEYFLRELLTHMEVFRTEISFVLAAIDIKSDKPFELLKRLSSIIIRMKDISLDYESKKSLGKLLWEVFAGFNIVSGYRERDVVEEMIEAI